jgi:hypothetical protein
MQRVILTRGTRAVKSNSYALLDASWGAPGCEVPQQLAITRISDHALDALVKIRETEHIREIVGHGSLSPMSRIRAI